MKKLVTALIIILLSIQIFPQIDPDEFPKIGYADMYWLKKDPAYYNHNPNIVDYSDSSYYYPRLQTLGLTHVVTYGDPIPFNSSYNSSIGIIDINFPRAINWTYHNPFKYSLGNGNNIDHKPYEVGGNIAILTEENGNFGFGSPSTCSWWVYPFQSQCVGDKSFNDNGLTVNRARVGVDQPGLITKANVNYLHLPYNYKWGFQFNYKMAIRAKIDGAPGSVNVARVHIWEETTQSFSSPSHYQSGNEQMFAYMESPSAPLTTIDFSYYLTADDFGGNSYVNLISPVFHKYLDAYSGEFSDLNIEIEWLGTRSMYVDNFAIYNTFYEDLFIADQTTQQNTRNLIKSDLNSLFSSVKNEPLFTHLYNDEPRIMMYRALGEVSSLSEQELGTGKYVTGATNALANDQLLFANSERRLPYILYDYYTITSDMDSSSDVSGSTNIQNAYQNLVNAYIGTVGYGVERYRGLKQAIQWSQNFTPGDLSDDVPMYSTIQVSGQKQITGGSLDYNIYRAPTYNEIMAEGNLSLCYGAKGMMYFPVFTTTPNSSGSGRAYYGLFDESGNIGGLIQDPAQPQVTNKRFDAVKGFNTYIDKIKNTLLELTWQNAFSIHQGQPTGTYIFNVETPNDDQAYRYVEVGLFKKTTEINNDNLEYFFVVNRRTLSTEQRTIDVQIHKTSSIFQNWKVTEVGTSNTWVISKTGSFETLYQPGEGKLFRMEPVMIAGGNIEYDESIPAGSSINVKGNVTVNQYRTLTLGAGCSLSFDPGINLTVNGVLNAQGTSSQPITFTRSGSSGGWGGKIKLNGSGASGSIIKYANISYATQVEAVNVPDFEISNCNFTNNYKAVYVNNSSGLISNNDITSDSVGHVIDIENASTVDCKGNEITKSNKQGFAILYGGGSDGYATENDIYGCDVGIGIIWSSSSSSHSSTYLAKNNRIRNCNDGFKVYRLSSGSFGIPPNDDDARNSIYGNTRNVSVAKSYPTYTASLEAPWNWWGNYPPNQSLFSVGLYGNFVFYPPLSSDPWYGIPKAAPKNIETPLSEESNESVAADIDPESIYYGIELRFQKKYKEAKDYFISYLAKHPDDQRAYVELYNCYSKETANDLINFFTKLPSEASEDHKLLLSYLYLKESRSASEAERQKNIDLAEKVNKNIIEENPNTSLSVRAKINNIYIALFSENNLAKASSIFTEITDKTQLSTERELADVKDAIEIYAGIHKGKGSGNSDSPIIKKDIASIEAPKEYALLGNYPNPFNPSTTISYNLPFISEVEITIYDILGNEVKSFVIPAQNSGTQEIIWNGRNINNEQVSSGIYLYHFKAVSLQKNNEVFEKSAKLILMK